MVTFNLKNIRLSMTGNVTANAPNGTDIVVLSGVKTLADARQIATVTYDEASEPFSTKDTLKFFGGSFALKE